MESRFHWAAPAATGPLVRVLLSKATGRRTMSTWNTLDADPAMVAALDAAGPRPDEGTTSAKRNWGTRFADACAVMFADKLRGERAFSRLEIRPCSDGTGRESLTGVGGKGNKKVDVIASTLSSGLQIALSLKAENFPSSGSYGKNLLNRLYELQDEVRAIHEYQPRAYVVGVLFLPLGSTGDRRTRSSFTRAVANLRTRTERSDFSAPTQFNRLDWSVIGLYVPDGTDARFTRGAVRYFDVMQAPPSVGRPRIDTTLDLSAVVGKIVNDYRLDSGEVLDFAEAEPDPD